MLEAELIAFGLSQKQAKIYLSTLDLGEAPASQVAKYCGERRLSTYSVLERLCNLKFLSCYQKKRVRIYRVNSPEVFLKHCDEQILRIQTKRDRFKDSLPDLKSSLLKNGVAAKGGHIHLIKDREFFKKRCALALKKVSEWYVIQDAEQFELFREICSLTKKVPRVILPISEHQQLRRRTRGMMARYVPDSHLTGKLHVMIIGNRVMFVLDSGKQFSAVEVEHSQISQMLKVIFLLIFKMDFFKG